MNVKRTAEKTLAIIGLILSILGILMGGALAALFHFMMSDPAVQIEFEQELLADPAITPEAIEVMNTVMNLFGGTMWFVIIALIIGTVLTIIGLVNIWNNKNPKLAGVLFLIAGVLSGLISLPSILLYIAGILCLVKKPSVMDKTPFADDSYDGSMRPL